MKNNTKPSKNITMGIAKLLFCLTLISILLTSVLYAKYTTQKIDSNSARVIRFGDIRLTESGDFQPDNVGMIVPGVKLTKKAVVDFDGSEASTYLFVKIVPSGGWITTDERCFSFVGGGKPLLEWSVDTDWTYLISDSGAYVYYLSLIPNTPLYGADIIAGGQVDVSDQITRKDIANMTDISIDISAAVVQSSGFENATAAWTSIQERRK